MKKTAKQEVKPFETNLEYLAGHLDYLRALAVQRMRERQPCAAPKEKDPLGLADEPAPASVEQLVEIRQKVESRLALLNQRIVVTLAKGEPKLPLEELVRSQKLDHFEKFVLMAVLGMDLDNDFARTMEQLAARPSRDTEIRSFLALLCDSIEAKIKARRYFIHTGRLLAGGLLHMNLSEDPTESDFMSMDLQISRRIASHILGEYDVDEQLMTFSSVIDPSVEIEQVVLPAGKREEVMELVTSREEYLQCRKDWGFDEVLSYGRGTVLLFSGPPGTGKTMLAHAVAKTAGYRLMLVDLHKVLAVSPRRGLDENIQRVFHEARLQHAILFFDEADEMFTDRAFNSAMPTLLRELERQDGICILATNRRQLLDEAMDRRILYKLDFEIPPPEQREQIWRKHLPPRAPLAADIDLKALAEEFDFSGGYIKNAVLCAMTRAMQRKGEERRITQGDLRHAARMQRSNQLSAHADKVTPRVSLEDVVVDADTRRQIESLVDAARRRPTVFSTWGFGKKSAGGRAISAVLSGPSGTGKSMTAEAIAGELGLNLFPVRMETLISKYVGDTEKHLAEVFKAAHDTEAVIFFDEADALFTRRMDGGGHHEHFINQQVNVLLTQLEKFDGVVLMATNRPDAFDSAFQRRIRFHIQFLMPDIQTRAELWRKLVPPEAPLADDVDFRELAETFAFAGGTIRSVLLRAAFAAANNGQVITSDLLFQAAEDEQPQKEPRGVVGFRVAV